MIFNIQTQQDNLGKLHINYFYKNATYHLVSFTAVFWMSRNAPPKVSLGGALRDIQKTAAKETTQ